MPIDDAAGRKAVREKRVPPQAATGSFLAPAASGAGTARVLRDDLHRLGLEAARRALKAHKGGDHAARDERS